MTLFPTTAAWKTMLAAAIAVGAAAAVLTADLHAQPMTSRRSVPPPSPAPAAPTSSGRAVDYKAKVVSHGPDRPDGTVWTLSGGVIFKSVDSVLRTDAATYNDKAQIATSPGALQIDDAQNTITAGKGVAYYKKRLADFVGNVRLVIRPRPQDKNASEGSLRREFKDPVTVLCESLQYNWRRKIGTATKGLTFKQKSRTLTADKAVYDGRAETLKLIGNVRGVDKEDDIRAATVLIGLKEGAEFLEISGSKDQPFVQGSFRVPDDTENKPGEEEVPEAAPDPAAPSPTAPAPVAPPR